MFHFSTDFFLFPEWFSEFLPRMNLNRIKLFERRKNLPNRLVPSIFKKNKIKIYLTYQRCWQKIRSFKKKKKIKINSPAPPNAPLTTVFIVNVIGVEIVDSIHDSIHEVYSVSRFVSRKQPLREKVVPIY